MNITQQYILPLEEVKIYLESIMEFGFTEYNDGGPFGCEPFGYYEDLKHAIEDSLRILLTRNAGGLFEDRMSMISRHVSEVVYEGSSWDYYENHPDWTDVNLMSQNLIFNRMVREALDEVMTLDTIVTDVMNGMFGSQWVWPMGKNPIITWLGKDIWIASIIV